MSREMGATVPRLDIVIVNWNSRDRLAACLDSIERSTLDGFEMGAIVVVDNASTDGSERAAERDAVRLTRNSTNVGFAAACNQGASMTGSEYLLFLNPDTRLNPNTLSKAVAFMEHPENERIGIVGIALEGVDGKIDRTCSRFPTMRSLLEESLGLDHMLPRRCLGSRMGEWDHNATCEVDQVMGAFFLVRRAVYDLLSGFDERFFMYFEEVDFARRARRAGWTSWYLAEARAYHEGGGVSQSVPSRRLLYVLRSRILYAAKYFGGSKASVLLLTSLFLEFPLRLGWAVARRQWRELGATIGAYARLCLSIPAIGHVLARGQE